MVMMNYIVIQLVMRSFAIQIRNALLKKIQSVSIIGLEVVDIGGGIFLYRAMRMEILKMNALMAMIMIAMVIRIVRILCVQERLDLEEKLVVRVMQIVLLALIM